MVRRGFLELPKLTYDPITGRTIKKKKKRKVLSITEKAIFWEKNKRHICHICKEKIHSLVGAELDHVRAASKGGRKVAWAHAGCNRLKGNKPLSQIHKRLGVYKPKKRKKKRLSANKYWINPITLKKEKRNNWGFGF